MPVSSKTAPHWLYLDPSSIDPTVSLLTVGQETVPRFSVAAATGSMVSQSLRLTFFTARTSETVTQVRQWTGTTAAGATPSLCRLGLYSVAANGDIALVASTPNDTTLFAAANTAYTKSFSASYALATGLRYALGILVVSAAAMPSFYSAAAALSATELATAPRLAAAVAAQADLPASVVAASLGLSALAFYSVVLP